METNRNAQSRQELYGVGKKLYKAIEDGVLKHLVAFGQEQWQDLTITINSKYAEALLVYMNDSKLWESETIKVNVVCMHKQLIVVTYDKHILDTFRTCLGSTIDL